MQDRVTFLEKLGDMVKAAKNAGNMISIDQVKEYFPDGSLTEEQMDMVFDYLLSQKIVVKGYMDIELTAEEQDYLATYELELEGIAPEKENEKETLFREIIAGQTLAKGRLIELYLKEVIAIAKEMRHPDVFLEDLIQEGNVGLILGVEMITDVQSAHQVIVGQVQKSICDYIKENEEEKEHDQMMIQKVDAMDSAITELTEELGRKVTVEELAMHLGMSEDEVADIIRLAGEDEEEEEEKQ